MIKELRGTAKKITTKILMVLLIASFAVWGIEDMLKKSVGNDIIATVGELEIPAMEYERGIYNESERLRQMLGNNFSPTLVEQLGIGSHVLQRLINNRLLILESNRIGLKVNDDAVVAKIRSTSQFFDDSGKFSKKVFEDTLRSGRITEQAYVKQVREEIATAMLVDAVTGAVSVPKNAALEIYKAREEERVVELYDIPSSLAEKAWKNAAEPTENQLKEYYDSNKEQLTIPEYRNISYIFWTQEDAKKIALKSQHAKNFDIETAYHERIDDFKKPERREIEQLLFSKEEDARKAYKEIREGKTLEYASIANRANKTSLGLVEISEMLEEAAANVFSLQKGDISEPIKSDFGWHIFHVKNILQPKTLSLEEARPELEKEFAQKISDEAMTSLSNAIEDAIAGGGTLAETASEFGLKLTTLQPLDRNGNTADGTKAKDLPDSEKFLTAAFDIDEKETSSPIAAKNGNYIVKIDKVTPASLKPFAEVKSSLVAKWKEQEKRVEFVKLAKKIADEFKNPANRDKLIKTYDMAAPKQLILNRKKGMQHNLQSYIVDNIFLLLPNQSTDIFVRLGDDKNNSETFSVAVLDTVIPVKINEKDKSYEADIYNINKEITGAMQNELMEQYLKNLADRYKVSINRDAIKTNTAAKENY